MASNRGNIRSIGIAPLLLCASLVVAVGGIIGHLELLRQTPPGLLAFHVRAVLLLWNAGVRSEQLAAGQTAPMLIHRLLPEQRVCSRQSPKKIKGSGRKNALKGKKYRERPLSKWTSNASGSI